MGLLLAKELRPRAGPSLRLARCGGQDNNQVLGPGMRKGEDHDARGG